MGKAGEGSEALPGELAGVRSLETGREDKQTGENCELFPGKPALYAHSPWPCILEESLFPTLYKWGD